MVQGLFVNKNLNSFFIFFVCLFVSNELKAESVDISKLRNSLTFTETFIGIKPKNGQSPFQTLTSKIEGAGYNLNSSVPEDANLGYQSKDVRSFLDLLIEKNVEQLAHNKAMMEAYKSSKYGSQSVNEEHIRDYEELNKMLNKGLNEIKSQYGDKFKDAIENKITYLTDVKCEIKSADTSSCRAFDRKTLNEIKRSRLSKNSAMAKAFSQGALNGVLDSSFLSEDLQTDESNPNQVEKNNASTIDQTIPKTNQECAVKSLNAYKEKIEKISESKYVAFVSQNSTAPCSLFRLSYTVEKSPFKRRLLEGSYFDLNGKAVTLDQKSFDDILRSWNILNGAKTATVKKAHKTANKSQENKTSPGKTPATR